jgi:hypothetical protein
MKVKICEKCQRKIRPKVEDYFQVDTYVKGKKVKEGFMHRKCHEEVEEEKRRTKRLLDSVEDMAARVGTLLDDSGIKPKPQMFEIK